MADRVASHYERHARSFDAARRRSFAERPWLDRFLMPLVPQARILDLGCGAGEPVARYVIDAGHRVTGVDISERMIALARTRFPRHRWLRADMRAALMDGSFAGVLAWDSLFHLPPLEQAEMLVKIAGWLDPGGMLLFNGGPEASERYGKQFGEELYHASLSPEDVRLLFGKLGLLEVAFAPEDQSAGGRSIWLARKDR